MKFTKSIFFFSLALIFFACQKDQDEMPVNPVDASKPAGTFNVNRSGVFQKQNGYNAEGNVEIGTDDETKQWLHFADNFNASLSTGAVTVYLSKNQNLTLNTSNSFLRVELVTKPGEHFYKIDPAANADFKFAILWCASAGVQFGNAELK